MRNSIECPHADMPTPDGQSLDAQNAIQLDSDHTLQGGVAATIRVPLAEAAARAIYVDGEDYRLDYPSNTCKIYIIS